MNSTKPLLAKMLKEVGSPVVIHREDDGTPCPCRTPEGFRDPAWHRAHPLEPVCNEQGFLTVPVEFTVQASIQPAKIGSVLSRINQVADKLLGDVLTDDKVGIFPCEWGSYTVDFTNWSEAGEDYVLYDGNRYMAVAYDKLPDLNGDPDHHWEVGLRLLRGRESDVGS